MIEKNTKIEAPSSPPKTTFSYKIYLHKKGGEKQNKKVQPVKWPDNIKHNSTKTKPITPPLLILGEDYGQPSWLT
jgi:hypothetical protein